MKILVNTLIATLLALIVTGCSVSDLADIEPTQWEKNQFERQVKKSVRAAVTTAGIDNGSTLVVTSEGDTLIAPAATAAATDIRTVYIDIQPRYPHRITSRSFEIISVTTIIISIGVIILVILLGLFILVIRRQHGRNKTIRQAIEQGYNLPEAYYTGTPGAAPVTINQVKMESIQNETSNAAPGQDSSGQCPPPFETSQTTETFTTSTPGSDRVFDLNAVKDALRNATTISAVPSVRELRNGIIITGIGIVLFMFFASVHEGGVACLAGGTMIVLGVAKLLTYYFTKKR